MTCKDFPKTLPLTLTNEVVQGYQFTTFSPPAPDTKVTTKKTNASNEQVAGDHYKKCSIQPWDYTIANDLDYFQGSIIKYVTRWKDKGWVEDLYKARHFLDKYIETMEQKHRHLKERPE